MWLGGLFAALALGLLLDGAFSRPQAQTSGERRGFPVRASALAASAVTISGSSVALDAIQCWNPGTLGYLQVFNTATVTVGTTAPAWSIGIASSGSISLQNLNAQMAAVKVAATTTATGSTATGQAFDCNFAIR